MPMVDIKVQGSKPHSGTNHQDSFDKAEVWKVHDTAEFINKMTMTSY